MWVWKLKKTLYGLRQGAKNWYDALHKALSELGFKHTDADQGVFLKVIRKDFVILAVHVDDCMVTGTSVFHVDKFKVDMNKRYRLTDSGPAAWLLGKTRPR